MTQAEAGDRGFPDGRHVSLDERRERPALHGGDVVPKPCGIQEGWEHFCELCKLLHAPSSVFLSGEFEAKRNFEQLRIQLT